MIREYEFRRLPGRDEWRGMERGKREGPCVLSRFGAGYSTSPELCPLPCSHTLASEPIFVDVRTGRKVLAPRVSSADRAGGTYLTGAMNTNLPSTNFFFLHIALTDTER